MSNLDIAGLLEHGAGNRKLRAYAYLTASFHETQNAARDIIDCLLPFLSAGVAKQAGQFLELEGLSTYLQSLGLMVPLYALQQLVPRLQELHLIEWNNAARRHLCNSAPPTTVLPIRNRATLENAFETFDQDFQDYALALGVPKPPVSTSWSDALIGFLRSDTAGREIRATQLKDTLILDTPGVETYLVARFIQDVQKKRRRDF